MGVHVSGVSSGNTFTPQDMNGIDEAVRYYLKFQPVPKKDFPDLSNKIIAVSDTAHKNKTFMCRSFEMCAHSYLFLLV